MEQQPDAAGRPEPVADPIQPYPYVGPPPVPPRSNNTVLWVVLGVVLGGGVLVFVALFFALAYSWSTAEPPPRVKVDNAPEVTLTQVPGEGAPPKYGDTVAYDACSIITMDMLANLGVPLSDSFGMGHDHLDGDVPVAAAVDQRSNAISSCHYVPGNGNSLFVKVHQTPFNSAEELARMQERGTRAGSAPRPEDGLTVIQWQDTKYENRNINIWKPDFLLDISFSTKQKTGFGTLDADAFATKLETLAKTAILKGPTAPMRHVYGDPVSKVKDPCQVASKAAFERAYPGHAGDTSFVDATYHLRAETPEYLRGRSTATEVTASCTRRNLVPEASLNDEQYRELEVSLSIWDSETSADERNRTSCTPKPSSNFGDPVEVTPSAGNGMTCLVDLTKDWHLAFQIDHVTITIGGALADDPPSTERRAQFLPAAKEIEKAGLFR